MAVGVALDLRAGAAEMVLGLLKLWAFVSVLVVKATVGPSQPNILHVKISNGTPLTDASHITTKPKRPRYISMYSGVEIHQYY